MQLTVIGSLILHSNMAGEEELELPERRRRRRRNDNTDEDDAERRERRRQARKERRSRSHANSGDERAENGSSGRRGRNKNKKRSNTAEEDGIGTQRQNGRVERDLELQEIRSEPRGPYFYHSLFIHSVTMVMLVYTLVAFEICCLYYNMCFNFDGDPTVPYADGNAILPSVLLIVFVVCPVGLYASSKVTKRIVWFHCFIALTIAALLMAVSFDAFLNGTSSETRDKVAKDWEGYEEFAHIYYTTQSDAADMLQTHLHVLAGLCITGSVVMLLSCCGGTHLLYRMGEDGEARGGF